MTGDAQTLGIEDVERIVGEAFRPSGSGGVGLEMEWLVYVRSDVSIPVSVETVRAAVGDTALPGGGAVSFEPGGQLELSTRRCDGPLAALEKLESDAEDLRARLDRCGLQMVELGMDPHRPPLRSLHLPRYDAMEAAFDANGPAGRQMMCSTASLQINVDFGPDPWQSWRDLSAFATVLGAAFANSPTTVDGPSPFASARSHVWSEIDASRTGPVPTGDLGDWVDYVLDARLLLIRTGSGASAVTDGTTLRTWVEHGHRLGHPDEGDIRYHLTTLFPPIRPRGWLELRTLDAIDTTARRVAVATVWALTNGAVGSHDLTRRSMALGDPWTGAASGFADPALHRAAIEMFELATAWAADHLPELAAEVDRWLTTMVRPGRTPADLRRDGLASPLPW